MGSILRRFISFKKYDRMIKEEDTSIAMAKIGNFRKFKILEISDDLESQGLRLKNDICLFRLLSSFQK